MNKTLYVVGIFITSLLIVHGYAWFIESELQSLQEIGSGNMELYSTRYQDLINGSVETGSFLIFALIVLIVGGTGVLAPIKNAILRWVVAVGSGILFFIAAVFYLAFYFESVL